ncbi:hypothetical protein [Candidatus Magnetobacterium casense]|uniref:Uncharacterized protein n=1 Tax=Candidatus Magnetobacterium casense TaxID=1455061 RepID=A0ABS6S4A2_9BACT|nr:hypothetical protein [Candidatus Magnetobacterium casensis]MBV6343679.1 hypothetical protein [Candidatus Magnetobacterium casensis]
MPRIQVISEGPIVPKVFSEMGYWTKEYADHVISVGYKEGEIAAFFQSPVDREAILDVIARHFVRTATPMGAVRG